MSSRRGASSWQRWSLGRWLARVLCVLLALIGLLPCLLGVLARSEPIQAWAAAETARVLKQEVGIDARYRVELSLWPLHLALLDLVVPANDGGSPVLQARRVAVTPRLFSLLAGQLDVGDVELEEPVARLVFRKGKLVNLKLPPSKPSDAKSEKLKRAPFATLAVTDARVQVDVDGVRLDSGNVNIDVIASKGPRFEIGVDIAEGRTSRTRVAKQRVEDGRKGTKVVRQVTEEDVLCRLQLRAFTDLKRVLVRRLAIRAWLDPDIAPGTRPSCAEGRASNHDTDVDLHVSQLAVERFSDGPPTVSGHVRVALPLGLVNRFTDDPPLNGYVALEGDGRWEPGMRLPEFHGQLEAERVKIDQFMVAGHLLAPVELVGDVVRAPRLDIRWSDGELVGEQLEIEPFAKGKPLRLASLTGQRLEFAAMMRDLGATPDALVEWGLHAVKVTRFEGTLEPVDLDGAISAETRAFSVSDKSWRSAAKQRMIHEDAADVSGRIGVHDDAFQLRKMRVTSRNSRLDVPLFSLGFNDTIALEVARSHVDLEEIGPLGPVDWGGQVELTARMSGSTDQPKLVGDLTIQQFIFGGFPLGDVTGARLHFQPLDLEIEYLRATKNLSSYRITRGLIDFDKKKDAIISDGEVESDDLRVRDFLEMFHLDEDPAFDTLDGRIGALRLAVHHDLKGPDDHCGEGFLRLRGSAAFDRLRFLDEQWGDAKAALDLRWLDVKAGHRGIELDVPSLVATKGTGSVVGSVAIRTGGKLSGTLVGTNIPVSSVDLLGNLVELVDARASGTAELFGTLDELGVNSVVDVGTARLGRRELGPSSLRIGLRPRSAPQTGERTRCGNLATEPLGRTARRRPAPLALAPSAAIPLTAPRAEGSSVPLPLASLAPVGSSPLPLASLAPVGSSTKPAPRLSPAAQRRAQERAERRAKRGDSNRVKGDVTIDGTLFGGQLRFDGVKIAQDPLQHTSGELRFVKLDLGALGELAPSERALSGTLTGALVVGDVPLKAPGGGRATLRLEELEVERAGARAELVTPGASLTLGRGQLRAEDLALRVGAQGASVVVELSGGLVELETAPRWAGTVALRPTRLDALLGRAVPGVSSAGGRVNGELRLSGLLAEPRYGGFVSLSDGRLAHSAINAPISELDVRVDFDEQEARITRGSARVGNGRVRLRGLAPLRGLEVGTIALGLDADGLALALGDGVEVQLGAKLAARWKPFAEARSEGEAERALPFVTGEVAVQSARYTRPITLSADLGALTRGASRTRFDSYDPESDFVRFAVRVRSERPMRIVNNLVDAELDVGREGVLLEGTNQRYGARGELVVRSGGRFRLRRNQFEIRQGAIRFDDATRITPKVDLTATTEYRRYSSASGPSTGSTSVSAGASGVASLGSALASTGGLWTITLHAHGNADNLKVDMSSDPALSQDDILLLITMGLTRAELDQAQSLSVGSSVALEALGSLTGADRVVTSAIPLIDEFNFGTAYSSRTGRTETTVIIGKRLTERLRASVSSGVGEAREVRSNVQWQLNRRLSVEGTYDNVNDISSSGIGNLGADVRWRIEFE